MKIRLFRKNRNAISACVISTGFLLVIPAQAENSIAPPITWTSESAPGYTGNAEDSYAASSGLWIIGSGSYEAQRLILSQTNLINKGTWNLSENATAKGKSSLGLSGKNGSVLYNDGGSILVDVKASGDASYSAATSSYTYSYACGIHFYNGSIINKGEISVSALATSYKGSATGTSFSCDLDNQGTIYSRADVDNKFGSTSCAFVWSTPGATMSNSGEIIGISTSSTGSSAVGLRLGWGSEYEITNSGHLTGIASSHGGYTYGIQIGTRLINSGTIEASASTTSSSEYVADLCLDSTADIHNSGTIKCDRLMIWSSSTSTAGLYMLDGSTLSPYSEGGSVSIYNSPGESSTLQVRSVLLGGEQYAAGLVLPKSEGSIVNVTSALNISKVKLELLDNVTLRMGGNFTTASDVVTTWNGKGLTVDNGENIYTVTMGNSFSAAWSTDFTMTPDGDTGEILLTQKEARKDVTLRDGSVKLSDGNLKATEHLTIGGGDKATSLTSANETLTISSQGSGRITETTVIAKNLVLSSGGGLVLDGALLTIDGGTGSLTNVRVTTDSHISSTNGADLTMNNVTIVFGSENSLPSASVASLLTVEDPLTQTSVSPNVYYLDCSSLENVNMSGNLTLDLSYWATDIETGGYDSLVLTFNDTVNFTDEASVRMTLNGTDYIAASSVENNVVLFNLPSESVPEPTTATLSLLALSMLMTKRRRK